jgi:putative endonuclease
MYHTYILFSIIKNKYYIGSTSNLEERIKKHNSNHKGFTGGVGDWQVVYYENYKSKSEATQREMQIKKWKSRKIIESLVKGN